MLLRHHKQPLSLPSAPCSRAAGQCASALLPLGLPGLPVQRGPAPPPAAHPGAGTFDFALAPGKVERGDQFNSGQLLSSAEKASSLVQLQAFSQFEDTAAAVAAASDAVECAVTEWGWACATMGLVALGLWSTKSEPGAAVIGGCAFSWSRPERGPRL